MNALEQNYRAGYEAYEHSSPRSNNPHDLDSAAGKAWRKGWTEAWRHYRGKAVSS